MIFAQQDESSTKFELNSIDLAILFNEMKLSAGTINKCPQKRIWHGFVPSPTELLT